MNVEESARNTSTFRDISGMLSRNDASALSIVPCFFHNSDDLKKKNLLTRVIRTPGANQTPHSNDIGNSMYNSNSMTNVSLVTSTRTPIKDLNSRKLKETKPKVLKDEEVPNPTGETEEGNMSVAVNNSLPDIPAQDLEDNVMNRSTYSFSRGNIGGADESRLNLMGRINQSQQQINTAILPNENETVIVNINEQTTVANIPPPQSNSQEVANPNPNIPNLNPVEIEPDITSNKAEDWQHELTTKANHKFIVAQWSLIFITLASLMAYASIIGETPANVLFIILALANSLHTYSILRFCNKKLFKTRKGFHKILKLLDWAVLTAYAVGAFLKTQEDDVLLLPYLAPVPILIIIRLIWVRKKTSLFRIGLWIQLILLTVRVEKIHDINWNAFFLIAYIMCIAFLARVVFMAKDIQQKLRLKTELQDNAYARLIRIKILGVGWDIMLSLYSIIFILFFAGLSVRLEDRKANIFLGFSLILAMVYSIVMIYLSLKYKYEITRSIIAKIIQNDPEHIKIKELLQKELEVGISRNRAPKFLFKVSSTYYQVAKPKMKPNRPEKKNQKMVFVTVADIPASADAPQEEDKEEKEEDQQINEEEEEEQSQEEEEEEDDEDNEEEEEEEDEQVGESSPEDKNCVICCDKKADAVFMECGHGGVCYHCALEVLKKEGKCYLCRKEIQKLLKLNDTTYNTNEDLAKVQIAITFNKNHKININESFQDILNEI